MHEKQSIHRLPSKDHTKLLAEALAKSAQKGDVFFLEGDLGAGKTTFARFFIRCLLSAAVDIESPTFSLLQTYLTPYFTIWHFDLYRLESPEETAELDMEEAFHEGVSLVEWPEKMGRYQPKRYVRLQFEGLGKRRHVILSSVGDWEGRLHGT